MRIALWLSLAALPCLASSPTDPASVLVVVQDNTAPEAGTGSANAGQFVADYYMAARGIPAGNIVHVSTFITTSQGGPCSPGGDCLVAHPTSVRVSNDDYLAQIEAPIRAWLAIGGRASSIKYIVMTYGVPYRIISRPPPDTHPTWATEDLVSIDDAIAGMNQNRQGGSGLTYRVNPYQGIDPSYVANQVHIDRFTGINNLYLVTRLDGPTAMIATGLVDKAIAAETQGINLRSGVGYFDYQGLGTGTGASQHPEDFQMVTGYNQCVLRGLVCVLNNQSTNGTGFLITSAPNTLWAWGWYSAASVNDVYTFAPGAVGAQFSSYTATFLRQQGAGAWVPLWLTRGITATWGVSTEPNSYLFSTAGDCLLRRMWSGYTFGEAGYSCTRCTGTVNVYVGDPLYRLKLIGPTYLGNGATLSGGASIH